MKFLITGSTGLLGRVLYKEALSRNYKVTGMARKDTDVTMDIRNDAVLTEHLKGTTYDIIINSAALVNVAECEEKPDKAYSINTFPLIPLTEWSKKNGKYLIHISTDHFFTDQGKKKNTEDAQVNLINVYAKTKYEAERIALRSANSLVIRTSIVGMRGHGNDAFAEFAYKVVAENRETKLFYDVFTSSIDTYSFAKSLFDLIEKKTIGLLNLASSEVYSKEDFVLELARQKEKKLTRISSTSGKILIPPRPLSLGLDVSLAEAKLGYKLPGMTDVVKSVINEIEGNRM